MKFHTNPAKEDELCENPRAVDTRDVDPIDHDLGYYYLFDKLDNIIHTHFTGQTKFCSREEARDARSSSIRHPFLEIYRHWENSESKQKAIKRKQERQKIHREIMSKISFKF